MLFIRGKRVSSAELRPEGVAWTLSRGKLAGEKEVWQRDGPCWDGAWFCCVCTSERWGMREDSESGEVTAGLRDAPAEGDSRSPAAARGTAERLFHQTYKYL